MKECRFLLLICGVTFLVFLSNAQAQEKYPNRPIEMVVAFTPGGATDLATRIYSKKLGEILKVPIVVVNRGAGSGIPGTISVARAKKDGYTLLGGVFSTEVTPLITKEATYDPLKDFFPLGYFGFSPMICSVRSDSPFKSFGELIEYARKNPGKLKDAHGGGVGAPAYLDLQLLSTKNNIKITIIPFSGGAEATLTLLGGHVDMTLSSALTQGAQIKAGKLRPLAITSKKRFPLFPDIPTMTELGYPHLSIETWLAVFAPTGVPQPVLKILIPAVEKAFKDPEVIARATAAYIVVEYMGPEALRKFMESETDLLRKLIKEI